MIPARGGSKRIPRKNLRLLCGKPLIQYTIEAAQKAEKLTTFVVSTEDYEIGTVASALGAYVVRRPDDLAGDDITTSAVLKHALEWMETDTDPYDMVVCLHPTSPIRDPKHIDQAIEKLSARPGLSILASVCALPEKTHPNVGEMWGNEFRCLRWGQYILNASIYAIKRDWLKAGGIHTAASMVPLIMDRRHSLDIDDEIDFRIAELFLSQP